MTNVRALGLAGVLGSLAVLTGCGSDDQANRSAEADSIDPVAAPGGTYNGVDYAAGDPSGPSGDFGSAEREAPASASTSGAPSISPTPGPGEDTAIIAADPPTGQSPQPPQQQVPAGTLTAGTWDDNRNLDRFLEYRSGLQQQGMQGVLGFSAAEHRAAQPLSLPHAHSTLDISLVIDTTGSMGDELRYLQTEFQAISAQIEASYPAAEQRWSLVVYRDVGDDYTTRPFDFTTDPVVFRQQLAEQAPGGGGDFPEAPDAAFQAMNQLSWRAEDATARLAFWVADAPHHDAKANALRAALQTAQDQGVHIYPVASSGVDELTELTMRSAAQLTGGRYLFLTDDSGVGAAHKEPSIPCYFVTKLDAAILRMVDIEMSGVYHEPATDEILRSGGNPQDGACQLQSGNNVLVF